MKPLNYSSSSWSTWVRDNGNVAKFLLKFHLIPYLIPHTHTHYFQFFLLFSLSGRYITSFMILFSLIRRFSSSNSAWRYRTPAPTHILQQAANQPSRASQSICEKWEEWWWWWWERLFGCGGVEWDADRIMYIMQGGSTLDSKTSNTSIRNFLTTH